MHNNSIGQFNNDPSVEGRLWAFNDAIHKLMWPERRVLQSDSAPPIQLKKDGGLVWRADEESSLVFRGYQIPDLVAGFTGWAPWALALLPWLPSMLFVLIGSLLIVPDKRLSKYFAPRLNWLSPYGRRIIPLMAGLLLALGIADFFLSWHWSGPLQVVEVASNWKMPFLRLEAFLFPLIPFALGMLLIRPFWKSGILHRVTPWLGTLCLVAAFVFAIGWGQSLSGRGDDVVLGPFPAGTPVNVLANMDHHAPILARLDATRALLDYFGTWQRAPKNNKPGIVEFEKNVAPSLMAVSQCPDFVMDRGHDFEFMQSWPDEEKEALIALLKTF